MIHEDIEFKNKVTIIVGDNGCGKTSLLEYLKGKHNDSAYLFNAGEFKPHIMPDYKIKLISQVYLIDEVENGFHPKNYDKVAELLKETDCKLYLTTHSLEFIDAMLYVFKGSYCELNPDNYYIISSVGDFIDEPFDTEKEANYYLENHQYYNYKVMTGEDYMYNVCKEVDKDIMLYNMTKKQILNFDMLYRLRYKSGLNVMD